MRNSGVLSLFLRELCFALRCATLSFFEFDKNADSIYDDVVRTLIFA